MIKMMEATGLGGPLYSVDQVPEHFHELFIVRGYRHPKSTPKQCLLSLFAATNETLNFWTHFLPSWYFMWILKGLSDTLDFRHDSYTWPLLGFMCVCCIFPLASATAHTFNTMSVRARHICFFLDYSALSLLTLGVAMGYRAYAFPSDFRDSWYGEHYLRLSFILAILCTFVSCETRFMKPSTFRKILRLGAFAIPYLVNNIPIFYRVLFGTAEEMNLLSWTNHVRQYVFSFLAAFLYATHFPERLYPGSFDIVGHSHQIFHVCSIIAATETLQGVLNDMQERRTSLEPVWEFGHAGSSIGVLASLLIINSLIILGFSYKLYRIVKIKAE